MKFDMLESSSIGLQLQDLETLLAKEVKHAPITYMELNNTLAMFGDLLAVVLGPNHQVSAAYQLFWMEWNQMKAAFLIDTTRVKNCNTSYTKCS